MQGLITLEGTELTAVEAEPWVPHSEKEGESKSNFKTTKLSPHLSYFHYKLSFDFLFLQRREFREIHI